MDRLKVIMLGIGIGLEGLIIVGLHLDWANFFFFLKGKKKKKV